MSAIGAAPWAVGLLSIIVWVSWGGAHYDFFEGEPVIANQSSPDPHPMPWVWRFLLAGETIGTAWLIWWGFHLEGVIPVGITVLGAALYESMVLLLYMAHNVNLSED